MTNSLMFNHFSRISSNYNSLRNIDSEPYTLIKEISNVDGLPVNALDIGCGAGANTFLFADALSGHNNFQNLYLTCLDINENMLETTKNYLKEKGVKNIETISGDANTLPINNQFDYIFTSNAIHHFDFSKFLKNSSELLKDNGLLFIYTRTKEQNEKNIWGKYFPKFIEKENRLYSIDEINSIVDEDNGLELRLIKEFRFDRESTLEDLEQKAKNHHYSTFCLYPKQEFEEALTEFKRKINNGRLIKHRAENLLLVLKK